MVAEISGQLVAIAFMLVVITFLLARCMVFLSVIADSCRRYDKQHKEEPDK